MSKISKAFEVRGAVQLGTRQRGAASHKRRILTSVSVVALVLSSNASFTQHANAAPQEAALEEVVVTGSRIVRDGYEAPTPLTVIGADVLESKANANLLDSLTSIPAVAGSKSLAQSAIGGNSSSLGVQGLNLRSLGGHRVLVLLDGRRMSTGSYYGVVDVTGVPSQLIQRVDIVTGGASAVYGSDAVSGVVNFVLDKTFTGVKGEISGGITNYGDQKNYKVDLSAGFGFAGGRGHVLVAGEHFRNYGIDGDGGRPVNSDGWLHLSNPNYTPTNGQPSIIFAPGAGASVLAPGGIITSGPLKGTSWGANGTPFQFQYGSIISAATGMFGGDWKLNDPIRGAQDFSPQQSNQSFFTHVSYDVTDDVKAYVEWSWSQNKLRIDQFRQWMTNNHVIKADNAYLPAATLAAMQAAGITQFNLSSWNADAPPVTLWSTRITNRIYGGFEGKFDAADTAWTWNAYYGYGGTHLSNGNNTGSRNLYALAVDAVRNSAGQIVCRSTLTNPTNGCKPWNAMGTGVNDANNGAASFAYWAPDGYQRGMIEQEVMSASLTGEPFALWAGPVSVAANIEHRTDKVNTVADPVSLAGQRFAGNLVQLNGKTSVMEGALETLVPLAKDESWAKSLDLSAAVRFTDYKVSGFVTTWKVGATYTPIDDIRFRATRSRDIRAPNILELFSNLNLGVGSSSIFRDYDAQGNPIPLPLVTTNLGGNRNLVPERADTTSFGVVLTPQFIEGFSVSADFWNISLKDAIDQVANQQVIDGCVLLKDPGLCANLTRNAAGVITTVTNVPYNIASRVMRGIDLDTTYNFPMERISSDWRGDFTFRGNITFYLKNAIESPFIARVNNVGVNFVGNNVDATSAANVPDWRMEASATYRLNPVSVTLTGRAISAGVVNSTYVECQSGCPASTATAPTISYNQMPGRFYMDANVSYAFDVGDAASADAFFSVKNIFNNPPPPQPAGSFHQSMTSNSFYYEMEGTVFRAGVRFRM